MHRRHLLRTGLHTGCGLILFSLMMGAWLGWSAPVQAQEGGPQGAAYRGARIFEENCVQCHGALGKGDGELADQAPNKIADFTDPAYSGSQSPQAIFDVITNGRMEALMPPWVNRLNEGERWDVAAYVWSLHTTQDGIAAGEQTYGEACASCHGVDGAGAGQQPPLTNLADAKYLAVTQDAWRQSVANDPHPAVSGTGDADLQLAIDFARGFNLGFNVTTAAVDGSGVMSVTVSNGTTSAALKDALVTLLVFDGETLVTQREATTDSEGRARFQSLPTDPSFAYVAQTFYQDVPFESAMLQFEPSHAGLDVPLAVFDGGAKAEDVRISRAHWVVGLESPQSLDVGELYAFANSSDRVYMGEPGAADGAPVVLTFEVPEGATNVSFEGGEMGGRFVEQDGKYIDTLPLAPGQRQILLRYSLPVVDGEVTLAHAIPYPVDNLNLLAPDLPGMMVEAPDWVEDEPLQTQGGAYRNYTLTQLEQGATPSARLAGINAAAMADANPSPEGNQQVIDPNATPGVSGTPVLTVVIAVAAGILLAAGLFFVMRRQRAQAALQPVRRDEMRQTLIEEIADLDDAYEAGEVTEADYQAQRRLLKTRLVTLMRDQGQ